MIILSKAIAAQDNGFLLGIILGEPTGVNAKLWTSKANAFNFCLDAGLGVRYFFE
jgi:hypothetical protein